MGKYIQKRGKSVADQLPHWDLSALGFSDEASVTNAMAQIEASVKKLSDERKDIPEFKDYELLEYIREFESVAVMARDLRNFVSLNACTQKNNSEAVALENKVTEFVKEQLEKLGFIHHELYALPEDKKFEHLSSAKLKDYDIWLMQNLLFEPSLEENNSALVRQLSSVVFGWINKYDEACARLNFVFNGKKYSQAEIEHIAYSDPNPEKRKKAQKVISDEFARHGFVFTSLLNTIFRNEDAEAKLYGDIGALELDAMANGMSNEDVLRVAAAASDSYVSVAQRYYKLLAKLLKKEQLNYTDRMMNPLEGENHKAYSWQECLDAVYEAFAPFGLSECAKAIVGKGWVDAKPAVGKRAGAFCIHGDKPFILMTFMGDYYSVHTLMHEMGHAIHHILLTNKVNILNDSTTIGMSEVASVFAEGLLFANMMAKAETNKEKLYLLLECVGNQISTIHRQIAFSKFEERVYRERKKGELSEERITQIYCEEMERYLGFPLEDDAKNSWMRVGHFFNTPFYVRYYAFAGFIVNQLQRAYNSGNVDNFENRYIDMLSNTGIEDFRSLLAPFKLDPDNEDFWTEAIDVMSGRVDEIERLAKEEGLL